MTLNRDIFERIDAIAPFSTQESWDNSGFLVGDLDAQVKVAVLTLDITHSAVDFAVENGASLIISHHPIIFSPIKALQAGSVVYRLAANSIGAICAHTNLDMASDGVNDALANALELVDVRGFIACGDGVFLGRMGELSSEYTAAELADHTKRALDAGGVRFADGGRPIKRVAVCGGAGGSMLWEAIAEGADALITGEVKHHEYIAAQQAGVTLIDATHYATEQVVLKPLAEMLSQAFPDIRFITCTGGDVLSFI